MKRCPICAEMVDDHLSVCPYCGEPLPGGTPSDKPQPEPSQPETPQTDTPSPDAADSSSGEMRFCPVCGEHIGAHLAICPVCFEPTGFDSTPIHEVAASGPVVEEHPSPEPPQPEVSPESTTIHKTERKLVFGPEPEPEPIVEPEPKVQPETRYRQEPEPRIEQETRYRQEPEPEPQRQRPQEEPYATVAPSKGANPLKWLLIALIALLAIGLGVLGYFLLKGDDEEKVPAVEPQEEVVAPTETNQLSGKALFNHRLDSVEENIPSEAYALNAYPDAKSPCLYYVLDDQLMVYHADTDKTESVKIPIMSGSGKVLDASKDEANDEYLLIDMGDKYGDYAFTYKMNTITESFERLDNEDTETSVQKQADQNIKTTVEKKSAKQNQRLRDEDEYGYPPPPPPPHMDRNEKDRPRRVFRGEDQRAQDRMDRVRREGRRPGENTPSSGTGFHLEPTNPRQSNSGSGIHLEKVERIPNQ